MTVADVRGAVEGRGHRSSRPPARPRRRPARCSESSSALTLASVSDAVRDCVPVVERPPPKRPVLKHRERVRSESVDLVGDGLRRAGADGDEDDHRGDADHHAEHRERRAELVRDDALRARCGALSRHLTRVPDHAVVDGVRRGSAPSRRRTTRARARGDLLLVGDHDDRPAGAVDAGRRSPCISGRDAVEVAGRLVGEDQRRVA